MNSVPDYLLDIDAVLKDDCEWKNGHAPDYSSKNEIYYKERLINHAPGSLEEQMTFLVKNYEKEILYKANPNQFRTVCIDKFRLSVNGPPWMSASDVIEIGNYNAFLGVHEYYNGKVIRPGEADELFHTVFGGGFHWEVMKVYTGPPKVSLKWHHWGKMTGQYKCPMRSGQTLTADPSNDLVEFYGILIINLNDQYQFCDMEVFYDPGTLIVPLTKNKTNN